MQRSAIHLSSAHRQARGLARPLLVVPTSTGPAADGRVSARPLSPLTRVQDYLTVMRRGQAGTLSRAEQQTRGTKPPNPSDVSHAGACGQSHPQPRR